MEVWLWMNVEFGFASWLMVWLTSVKGLVSQTHAWDLSNIYTTNGTQGSAAASDGIYPQNGLTSLNAGVRVCCWRVCVPRFLAQWAPGGCRTLPLPVLCVPPVGDQRFQHHLQLALPHQHPLPPQRGITDLFCWAPCAERRQLSRYRWFCCGQSGVS